MSSSHLDLYESVGGLAPIGLAELVDAADLQTRNDRKYIVPLADVVDLTERVPIGSRVLTIDGRTQFAYRSTYFDTADLRSYLGAAHRRPSRFKVRVRDYIESDLSMLEVKTRDRRGRTVKTRAVAAPCEAFGLTATGRAFAAGFEQIGVLAGHLVPTLVTGYQRSTLLLAGGPTARITIDTALTWHTYGGQPFDLGPYAIVETKSAGSACDFDHQLWTAGHRPVTFSKYCTGLAAATTALPSNRWHRTLATYFGSAAPTRQPCSLVPVAL